MAPQMHTALKRKHDYQPKCSTEDILLDLKKLSEFGFGSGGNLHRGILSHLIWKITGGKLSDDI